MSMLPTSDLDRIKTAIATTPSPTRRQARTTRRWLSWTAALVLACTSLMHGMAAFDAKPWRYTLTTAIAVGLFAVFLGGVLHRYSTSTMGPRRDLLRRANRLAMPGLLIGSAVGNIVAPETLRWPDASPVCHLPCAMLLLMSGGLLAWFGVRSLRHADPLTPRTTAATIGAAAGVWASLAVSLQCLSSDPLHTLGTHVLPVGIIMLLTIRLGAKSVGLHYAEPE